MEMSYSSIHFGARRLYSHVWVSRFYPGSSAQMYSLSTRRFVTRVNDDVIDDLGSLVRVLGFLPTDRDCQITCVSPQGVIKTVSLRPNLRDFPTSEIRKMEGSQDWQCREL